MPKILVRKKVTLEFLGEEYKEGFVNFSSISMREYDDIDKKLADLKKEGDDHSSVAFVRDMVLERFLNGKFPVDGKLEDIEKDDLLDLPTEFFIQAMAQLNGSQSPN
jgi:hypothetical protein